MSSDVHPLRRRKHRRGKRKRKDTTPPDAGAIALPVASNPDHIASLRQRLALLKQQKA